MNPGVIYSDSPPALYWQKLPTQHWDQGSKQLRRPGGSTQPSNVSASITVHNGVLNTSSGQRVGMSKYQLYILLYPILAGSSHNSSANSDIPAHELGFGNCISNAPLLLRNLHNCWNPLLSQGVCMSPQVLRWPLIPSSLKQKCLSIDNRTKNVTPEAASKNACPVSELIYADDYAGGEKKAN